MVKFCIIFGWLQYSSENLKHNNQSQMQKQIDRENIVPSGRIWGTLIPKFNWIYKIVI